MQSLFLQMVYDLLQVYMSDEKDYIPPGGPEISSLIIIDRGRPARSYLLSNYS